VVDSQSDRIQGANEVTLNIDLDPVKAEGSLEGHFTMSPRVGNGTWRGEVRGSIREGIVMASGIARGTGGLTGAVLRVDFRQVKQLSAAPPCKDPKAFFEMEGWILEGE
jgi:hypothetical protein